MKRIVFIGPESSGKTFCAAYISEKYRLNVVPEYLREFWNEHGAVIEEDMAYIAKKQLDDEDLLGKGELVILDTNLITLKVYHEWYFKQSPVWFKELFEGSRYHHYLLFKPDIPWVDDGQRDQPNQRQELFEAFEQALKQLKVDYTVVSGDYSQRLEQVDQLFRCWVSE